MKQKDGSVIILDSTQDVEAATTSQLIQNASDDLCWKNFLGIIDYVMELYHMRQSINMPGEDSVEIEEMFIRAIENLHEASEKIIPQLRKHNETMKATLKNLQLKKENLNDPT